MNTNENEREDPDVVYDASRLKWAVYVDLTGRHRRVGVPVALFESPMDADHYVRKCFANPEAGDVYPWSPPAISLVISKDEAAPLRGADGAWVVQKDRVIQGVYADAPGLTPNDVLAWHRNESGEWPNTPLFAAHWVVNTVPPGFVEKRREVAAEAARLEAAKQAAKDRMERDVRRAAKQKLLELHEKEIARLEADLAALDAEDGAEKGQQPR